MKKLLSTIKKIFSPEKQHRLEDFEIICEKCSRKINVWTHSSLCPHPTVKDWLGVEPSTMEEINKKDN